MLVKPDDDKRDIQLSDAPPLEMTADALLADFTHYFGRTLGRRTVHTDSPFLYQALVYAARDRIMERWNRTRRDKEAANARTVSYLSLEYLMGRLLYNALLNLGITDEAREALHRIGLNLEEVCERAIGCQNARVVRCFKFTQVYF